MLFKEFTEHGIFVEVGPYDAEVDTTDECKTNTKRKREVG